MNGLLQMQVNKHIRENNGPITTQELMMLASNVDHCQVLADVHSNEDLGKFYVENGFREDLDALPDSVYDLLDYAKIGKQMRESEAGTFTPHGYVVRTEELEPLPEHEPQREISYMIRLTLMNHENEPNWHWSGVLSATCCCIANRMIWISAHRRVPSSLSIFCAVLGMMASGIWAANSARSARCAGVRTAPR